MMLPYERYLKPISRQLRKNSTDTEKIIWRRLRRRQLEGVAFFRQKPLGPYIVDFYAPSIELVIEVDGGQHAEPDHRESDEFRDEFLRQLNVKVLRFGNREVFQELEAVLEMIRLEIKKLKSPEEKSPPTMEID